MILYNPVMNMMDLREGAGAGFVAGMNESVLKSISPALHLRKETPPTLILDGTKDNLYPQIQAFMEKAKSVGAPAETFYAEDQPHGFFNRPPWLQKTTQAADDFLCRIGYLSKEPKVPLPSEPARWGNGRQKQRQ
jgi:acetyl esterase/lipase